MNWNPHQLFQGLSECGGFTASGLAARPLSVLVIPSQCDVWSDEKRTQEGANRPLKQLCQRKNREMIDVPTDDQPFLVE